MAKILRAVKPNAGIRAAYRRRLEGMIDEMRRSVVWWLRAEYRRQEPRIAEDASPARDLEKRLKRLFRYWLRRWDEKAEKLAREFVEGARRRSAKSMKAALRAAGFTVRFQSSRDLDSVTEAMISWNVGLIKSIPRQYLEDVRGIVMRSVSMGRDVAFLVDELDKRYAVTRRRAKFIARDQANKATEAIKQARDKALGITEGVWVHIPGVKTSRHTHQAMNGKRFALAEGLYDPAVERKVLPGELPGCQCTYRAVIPEFGD